MNPKQVVLDTNIVIDLLKKVPSVVAQFLNLQDSRTRSAVDAQPQALPNDGY